MIENIKKYAGILGAAVIAILGALLFRKSKQLDTAQGEIAHDQASTEIKLNDQATDAARVNADDLLAAYEKLKRGDS